MKIEFKIGDLIKIIDSGYNSDYNWAERMIKQTRYYILWFFFVQGIEKYGDEIVYNIGGSCFPGHYPSNSLQLLVRLNPNYKREDFKEYSGYVEYMEHLYELWLEKRKELINLGK